jgi:uncharacterized alpha-E superfamily protein
VPRSLHACMNDIYDILRGLSDDTQLEAERLAGELHAKLHYGRIQQIFDVGLHEYLMGFLDGIGNLASEIDKEFLVPVYPVQAVRQVAGTQSQFN